MNLISNSLLLAFSYKKGDKTEEYMANPGGITGWASQHPNVKDVSSEPGYYDCAGEVPVVELIATLEEEMKDNEHPMEEDYNLLKFLENHEVVGGTVYVSISEWESGY